MSGVDISIALAIPKDLIAEKFYQKKQYCAAAIGNTPLFTDGSSGDIEVQSPITGTTIASVGISNADQVDTAIRTANETFQQWRLIPAPERGRLVAAIGDIARERKTQLAQLITLEMGKIAQEALGEVQEWIDMCDFSVGLSRQLYGLSIASERPQHRMMEQWHPLGPIGVISAFNFPMAVWSWNAMLGLVCGNTIIWKPSEKTPLCALASHQIVIEAIERLGEPFKPFVKGLSSVIMGQANTGEQLAHDQRLPLISATGSTRMGKSVAVAVGARLGRSLLELGGNNAAIVAPSAKLDMALTGIVFSAAGTCGQRCTSLRRLIVHTSVYHQVKSTLINAFQQMKIGDPRDPDTLIGPIIDKAAFEAMQKALEQALTAGGQALCGGQRAVAQNIEAGTQYDNAYYVTPALVEINAEAPILQQETFAPILYLMKYSTIEEAIAIQNNVPQGLSSSIFTQNMQEAEQFLCASGSDCGIANVNIGTSGAEIGGAFGGEKETGGGRESGSDSWKNYMRRATNTINYGSDLPLAQGVQFSLQLDG